MKFVAKLSILLPISERNLATCSTFLACAAAAGKEQANTWGDLNARILCLECALAMTKSENNSHESEQSASGGAKVTRMTHLEVQNDGPDETQDELGIPVDNVLCSDVHQLYLQINFGTCQHTFFNSKKLKHE